MPRLTGKATGRFRLDTPWRAAGRFLFIAPLQAAFVLILMSFENPLRIALAAMMLALQPTMWRWLHTSNWRWAEQLEISLKMRV